MQHTIEVRFQCPDSYYEISNDNPSMGECAVEELTSLALTDLFDVVLIEEVAVIFPPADVHADDPITISIRAQGLDLLPTADSVYLDCAIESHLACALSEFFGSLNVASCTVC
jgi:hypothetical protein